MQGKCEGKLLGGGLRYWREEEAEANNVTVDRFSPHRNKSDFLKDLINKVARLIINDIGNYSNGETAGDVQIQF